jgi:hypothetical protein
MYEIPLQFSLLARYRQTLAPHFKARPYSGYTRAPWLWRITPRSGCSTNNYFAPSEIAQTLRDSTRGRLKVDKKRQFILDNGSQLFLKIFASWQSDKFFI